jgi:hypothetical protein
MRHARVAPTPEFCPRSIPLHPNAGRAAFSATIIGALAIALGACGSYPPPTERMASSEATIRGAQEVGATGVPAAALSVKLAQEEVQKAKQLMQDGDNRRAELVLMRAQADAELALAQAREAQAKNDAAAALEQVKAMRGK